MPIVLLTDFGNVDGYVGVMKGVISRIAPKATLIDLSHEIPPFDRMQAGLTLRTSYRFFPKGTIFVCVVDPGVGSARKPILIQTKDYFFVGPDNSIFTLALADQKIEKIIHLKNSKYFLKTEMSSTFQGRDLFAPIAAHLSCGISPDQLGPRLFTYEQWEGLNPEAKNGKIIGQVLSIDRFGNAITNLSKEFILRHIPDLSFVAKIKSKKIKTLKNHYAEGNAREPFCIFGSSQLLEVSLNQASAALMLKIKRGDTLILSKLSSHSPSDYRTLSIRKSNPRRRLSKKS